MTTDPHPHWKPNNGSSRHPQTVAEWDHQNDPIGEALRHSIRRLNVAGDYDDPRAPDQMCLVLRGDIIRLMHDWIHKNAVFEIWCKEREDARAAVDAANVAVTAGDRDA